MLTKNNNVIIFFLLQISALFTREIPMTGQESPPKIPNREPQTIVFPEEATSKAFHEKLLELTRLTRQGYWPIKVTLDTQSGWYEQHVLLEHEENPIPTENS
jgi:hypothetical protein